jgi:hypothetical protein
MKITNESKNIGILYHYTSLENALNIIKSGQLKSSISDQGKEAISFTRNKNFHKRNTMNGVSNEVRLVLDGTSLSNNYKISPYSQSGFEKNTPNFESEEVITSKTPFQIPIEKYMISIDVPVSKSKLLLNFKLYLNLFSLVTKKGIKLQTMDNKGSTIPFINVLKFLKTFKTKEK